MSSTYTRFYTDKLNGKVLGVCAGIADYTGINSIWVRLGFLGLVLMTGGSILPFYFLVGFLADKKPQQLYVDRDEQQFWQGVRQSPARTARAVKGQLRDLHNAQ